MANSSPGFDNDLAARTALLNAFSRAALVFVAGILVWGFNRIDSSLEKLNDSLKQVQISIGRLEIERDGIKERLSALDARIAGREGSPPPALGSGDNRLPPK
jgi:hypothetical protein